MIELEFGSREEASRAAAEQIVAALLRRSEAQGSASLVVSGGTSPTQCLRELSKEDAGWENVHVVLSDERWVPADHDDSNEKLVRDTLLTGNASAATLLPMYRDDVSVDVRSEQIDRELRTLPFPFACALLGMGADGHFASLFPDSEQLADGLDPDYERLCLPVRTKASPHPRISLTLSALSRSDEIILLIFGNDKRQTLQAAKATPDSFPVSRLLRQKRAPVSVYWAP